jgi:hypothetical protein
MHRHSKSDSAPISAGEVSTGIGSFREIVRSLIGRVALSFGRTNLEERKKATRQRQAIKMTLPGD